MQSTRHTKPHATNFGVQCIHQIAKKKKQKTKENQEHIFMQICLKQATRRISRETWHHTSIP
jgi:ribosomal protein L37AE/L43A